MTAYIIRRLLLIIPTLFGIMIINFTVVQFAPGGPVERLIAQITGEDVSATARISGEAGGEAGAAQPRAFDGSGTSKYRGAQGLDPEFIKEIEALYGFDKPAYERFYIMVGNYLVFDFGQSYFQDRDVIDIVLDKLPVSISLGLWSTLLVYFISIPLGVRKAVRDGSRMDVWTSAVIIVGQAIPGFLFAILLIVLFAGGSYFDWFPLRGLVSEGWEDFGLFHKIYDYFWHITLPVVAMTIGGFAFLTMFTKNVFLDQINMQYVLTARAKGLTERRVLYRHVFRNAMLLIIAGFPGLFLSLFLGASIIIEVIFSLDGLGLLGFESVVNRDFPIMFATLYFFGLIGLVFGIISDFVLTVVDPRVNFEAGDV
ncbi:MAG: microcin C ABC transporter permease YejB [Proteobacteria bacterium]|nr:microcin C ABC transporter permease YejB [Pseudomonadota bacterium]